MDEIYENFKDLEKDLPIKIIVSNPTNNNQYKKILLEKVENTYHISKYTEKQVFNENISEAILINKLIEYLDIFK